MEYVYFNAKVAETQTSLWEGYNHYMESNELKLYQNLYFDNIILYLAYGVHPWYL